MESVALIVRELKWEGGNGCWRRIKSPYWNPCFILQKLWFFFPCTLPVLNVCSLMWKYSELLNFQWKLLFQHVMCALHKVLSSKTPALMIFFSHEYLNYCLEAPNLAMIPTLVSLIQGRKYEISALPKPQQPQFLANIFCIFRWTLH